MKALWPLFSLVCHRIPAYPLGTRLIYSSFVYSGDAKRLTFVQQQLTNKTGRFHTIERRDVFGSVNDLFSKEEVLSEFPLQIKFHGEVGFDSGGVCRDMFSAYWEHAYKQYFDGNSVLIPVLHPEADMQSFPRLGLVLSHGYLVSGFLPTRIAFPAVASILLGPHVEVPDSSLVETFGDSLNPVERSVIKECLSVRSAEFPGNLLSQLIAVLSRFGCRTQPTPATLRARLAGIGKYEFQVKPLAAFCSISSGIPSLEKSFWSSFSIEELHKLHVTLDGSAKKVLELLAEPVAANECESRVFGYLQELIGNMKRDEIRRFLRFTTGSSVMIAREISVTFNSLSGFARRPIAHTCACVLELPLTYTTYLDFENEFNAILSDDEYSWEMHAI